MLMASYSIYYIEKIYNIFTWSHPELTRELIYSLLFYILLVSLVPLRFIIMGGLLALIIPVFVPLFASIGRIICRLSPTSSNS